MPSSQSKKRARSPDEPLAGPSRRGRAIRLEPDSFWQPAAALNHTNRSGSDALVPLSGPLNARATPNGSVQEPELRQLRVQPSSRSLARPLPAASSSASGHDADRTADSGSAPVLTSSPTTTGGPRVGVSRSKGTERSRQPSMRNGLPEAAAEAAPISIENGSRVSESSSRQDLAASGRAQSRTRYAYPEFQ